MVQINNPFQAQTPLGAAITQLGTAIFGSTLSPSEREKQRLENEFLRARTRSEEADARQATAVMGAQRSIGDIFGQALAARTATSAPVADPGVAGPARALAATGADQTRTAGREFLGQVPFRLAQAAAPTIGDPQDLANLFNFAQANTLDVPDTAVLRSLAGRGALPDQNTAVSVAGQNRIAERNAALNPSEPFTEVNFLDTTTGQFVGSGFVDRTSRAIFDAQGNQIQLPQNVVFASKPGVDAADAAGLPGADKTELRQVRDDVFGARTQTERALGIVGEIGTMITDPDAPLALGNLGRFAGVLSGVRAQAAAAFERQGIVIETTLDPATFQDRLQELGVKSAEAQSAIMDLAFSIANAREGGRLTDQDIARALQTIGASHSDPRLFIAALNRTAERLIRDDRILRTNTKARFANNPAAIQEILALQDLTNPLTPFVRTQQGGAAGTASPAPAQGGGTVRLRFDRNGNPIQ